MLAAYRRTDSRAAHLTGPPDRGRLGELRRLVAVASARAGVLSRRVDDLVVAVNEVATNSIIHARGRGTAKMWRD